MGTELRPDRRFERPVLMSVAGLATANEASPFFASGPPARIPSSRRQEDFTPVTVARFV